MNETNERFLKAVLERLPAERVVEIHLFPAIRQGLMETGVAQERLHVLVAQDLEVARGRTHDRPRLAQRCERAVDVLPVLDPRGIDDAELRLAHHRPNPINTSPGRR